MAKRSATSGWPRWKAVSKQATCRTCRLPLQDRFYGRKVVRLVQRCERHQLPKTLKHQFVDDCRRAVVRAAVDDAVPDDNGKSAADLRAKKSYDLVECRRHGVHLRRRPRLIDE